MNTIDTHQHFWKYDAVRDSWITDDMKVIQKDFLPADLESILKENNIDGSVVIQSDQSEKENEFQLKNAEQYNFIKGVVGWVDLLAEGVKERLLYYKQYKKIKGIQACVARRAAERFDAYRRIQERNWLVTYIRIYL